MTQVVSKKIYRKLSNKNQVAIPVKLMKKLNISPKSMICLTESNNQIIMKPINHPIKSLRGIFKQGHGKSGTKILLENRKIDQEKNFKKHNLS